MIDGASDEIAEKKSMQYKLDQNIKVFILIQIRKGIIQYYVAFPHNIYPPPDAAKSLMIQK